MELGTRETFVFVIKNLAWGGGGGQIYIQILVVLFISELKILLPLYLRKL